MAFNLKKQTAQRTVTLNDQHPSAPLQLYEKAYAAEKETHDQHALRWRMVAFLRGSLFLASILTLFFGSASVAGFAIPWVVLAGILFVGFLGVAFYHELMERQIRISRLLMKIYDHSIARIERDWARIQVVDCKPSAKFEPVSVDLDLFGPESLYRLIGIAKTPNGVATLGNWIENPASTEEIEARQIAVAELKDQHDWRIDFALRCEQLAASQSGPSRFVSWAESNDWIHRRSWLLWLCRLTAITSIGAIILLVAGLVPLIVAGPILLVTTIVNFILSVFFAGTIHDIFNSISSHRHEIAHYTKLFQGISDFESKSPFLKEIQSQLTEEPNNVLRHVDSLSLLNWLANIRKNGVLFVVYLLFEFLFMWDVHVLHLLERWKHRNGRLARSWFEALGKWEAILALSKLAYDNPDWNFATVKQQSDSRATIECKKLGHPLMDDSRVCNDVVVGPPGTVLLVTGSNMSGKSTLLRSIGVNTVLAQMGSVVCAQEMKLPPVVIETSMRIVDSLAAGTSFFMAELKRLKEIVDQANSYSGQSQQTLIFLLDEILQGTNSAERQIAVSRVVESLIKQGAIGAISTHDLDLATTPELRDACLPIHFTEKFETVEGKRKMTFDYIARNGIAPTTNALKLLEMVGLSEE